MSYLDIVRAARKARKVRTEEKATALEHAPECEISEISEKSPEVQAKGALPGFVPHPVLSGLRVYRGDVEASLTPDDWDGVAPAGCGVPAACRTLGPCAQFTEHGRCRAALDTTRPATAECEISEISPTGPDAENPEAEQSEGEGLYLAHPRDVLDWWRSQPGNERPASFDSIPETAGEYWGVVGEWFSEAMTSRGGAAGFGGQAFYAAATHYCSSYRGKWRCSAKDKDPDYQRALDYAVMAYDRLLYAKELVEELLLGLGVDEEQLDGLANPKPAEKRSA